MSSNKPQESCCAKTILREGKPSGTIQKFGKIDCYVTSNYTSDSSKYLIMFPAIYGISLGNIKLLADNFAQSLNYPVIAMDIVDNDPFIKDSDVSFDDWLAKHNPQMTINLVNDFIDYFKSTHKNYKFLAGIGYCFGAKYLAHHLTINGIFNVGAFAHPSFVTDDEVDAITKPLILSCAETDAIFTKDLRYKSEQILQKNNIHYQFDLFSRVTHGFTHSGDLSIPDIRYAVEKSLLDQVFFFNYHDST